MTLPIRMRRSPKRVIKFYDGRGTAEQRFKEGRNALRWTRLSCRRFKDNRAPLQLFALAYNLANFLRELALPRSVQAWTLTTPRERAASRRLMPWWWAWWASLAAAS